MIKLFFYTAVVFSFWFGFFWLLLHGEEMLLNYIDKQEKYNARMFLIYAPIIAASIITFVHILDPKK